MRKTVEKMVEKPERLELFLKEELGLSRHQISQAKFR